MDELKDMGYRVQDVIECCASCSNSDVIDMSLIICMQCNEEVSPIGICERYDRQLDE